MLPELLPAAAVVIALMAVALLFLIRRLRREQPSELVARFERTGEACLAFSDGVRADVVVALAVRGPAGEPIGLDEGALLDALTEACSELSLGPEQRKPSQLEAALAELLPKKLGRSVQAIVVESLAVRAT